MTRAILLFLLIATVGYADPPPNMILVFIDDMGWADLSCFGNTDAETPHIDRMASEGIAFDQFYVNSPICSPSRVALSTGQYPQRWNITSYLAARNLNHQRGIADWLDPEAPMLARSLQATGYATGHFGKWHMGGQRDVTDAPAITEYGFDVSLTNFYGMENLPDLAVRHGPWKLLCDYDGSRPQLYHLVTDPGESANLAESQPDLASELVTSVTNWFQSMPTRRAQNLNRGDPP